MKIKLRCTIFGHDFRKILTDGIYNSDYCRHCGLSKEDLIRMDT